MIDFREIRRLPSIVLSGLLLAAISLGCSDTDRRGDDFYDDPWGGSTDAGTRGDGGTAVDGDFTDETLGAFDRLSAIERGGGSLPRAFTRIGDKVVFAADRETAKGHVKLWVTDNTRAGTKEIAGVSPVVYREGEIAEVGGKAVFPGWGWQSTKEQIWVTDGTEAGTVLLADAVMKPQTKTFIRALGKLFFEADDGTHGYEMWVTDGTPAGTQMVFDIVPGAQGLSIVESIEWDGRLFLLADDALSARQLWVTDGTASGTQRLTAGEPYVKNAPALSIFKNRLFFSYQKIGDAGGVTELWVTDGTVAGTQPLRTATGEGGSSPANPRAFFILGDKLLFFAEGTDSYRALWTTDGTISGTTELGPFEDDKEQLPRILPDGSRAVFVGYSPERRGDRRLWGTDGTAEGTSIIAPVRALSIDHFVPIGDRFLFFGGSHDAEEGFEPWITDGTSEGTALIKDLSPEGGSFYVESSGMVSFGDKAYFPAAVSRHDFQLIVSDGTAGGTKPLLADGAIKVTNTLGYARDERLPARSMGHLFVFGDTLLMPANFHGVGFELYRLKL